MLCLRRYLNPGLPAEPAAVLHSVGNAVRRFMEGSLAAGCTLVGL